MELSALPNGRGIHPARPLLRSISNEAARENPMGLDIAGQVGQLSWGIVCLILFVAVALNARS